jgi:hypothetical protein
MATPRHTTMLHSVLAKDGRGVVQHAKRQWTKFLYICWYIINMMMISFGAGDISQELSVSDSKD